MEREAIERLATDLVGEIGTLRSRIDDEPAFGMLAYLLQLAAEEAARVGSGDDHLIPEGRPRPRVPRRPSGE